MGKVDWPKLGTLTHERSFGDVKTVRRKAKTPVCCTQWGLEGKPDAGNPPVPFGKWERRRSFAQSTAHHRALSRLHCAATWHLFT